MNLTEQVSRVVVEAQRSTRAGSVVDEQEWFEAGEPDTEVEVPLQDLPIPGRRRPAGPPVWFMVATIVLLMGIGFIVGHQLGQG